MRPLKNNWMPGIAFIQWASQPVLRYFQVDSRIPLGPAGHGAISQDWLCLGAPPASIILHPAASYNIRKRWLNLPGWGYGGRLGDRKCRRAPNSYPLDRFVELVTVVLSDRPKPSVVLLCCQMCMLHAMAYGPPATRKANAASLLPQPEYCVAWLRRLTGIVTTARSHVVPPAKEAMRIIREALPAHGSQY